MFVELLDNDDIIKLLSAGILYNRKDYNFKILQKNIVEEGRLEVIYNRNSYLGEKNEKDTLLDFAASGNVCGGHTLPYRRGMYEIMEAKGMGDKYVGHYKDKATTQVETKATQSIRGHLAEIAEDADDMQKGLTPDFVHDCDRPPSFKYNYYYKPKDYGDEPSENNSDIQIVIK